MITKERIKELITLVKEFNGFLTIRHFPQECLEFAINLYALYYGDGYVIEIGKSVNFGNEYVKITGENIDHLSGRLETILNNSILNEIHQALKNFRWEAEELKYFDRFPERHGLFKAEVMRLKKENQLSRIEPINFFTK